MYPFGAKCHGLPGFQGINYYVTVVFSHSCIGLGNGRVKNVPVHTILKKAQRKSMANWILGLHFYFSKIKIKPT